MKSEKVPTGSAGGTEAEANSSESLGTEIDGIINGVDVPILVVNQNCILTRFNRAASEVLSLTSSDIGRVPSAIAAVGDLENLEKLCAQVIRDETPIRRDIAIGDRRFVIRIAPYTQTGGPLKGAVLTFANVTALRTSLEQAVYEREYTKAVLNAVGPLVVLNAELRIQSANRAFYALFGVSRDEIQNVSLQTLGDDSWKRSEFWHSLRSVLSGSGEFEQQEIERTFSSLGSRTLLIRRAPDFSR